MVVVVVVILFIKILSMVTFIMMRVLNMYMIIHAIGNSVKLEYVHILQGFFDFLCNRLFAYFDPTSRSFSVF